MGWGRYWSKWVADERAAVGQVGNRSRRSQTHREVEPMTIELRRPAIRVTVVTAGLLVLVPPVVAQVPKAEFHLPTVPADHKHARELLANSLRYMDPANKLSDPVSGYPYEGWN